LPNATEGSGAATVFSVPAFLSAVCVLLLLVLPQDIMANAKVAMVIKMNSFFMMKWI
jgi:hypothetical protein